MSRRHNSPPKFSLLSFQDIITAVSGVILLVTLLLAIELSQRTLGDSPKYAMAEAADMLQASIDEANRQIKELEQILDTSGVHDRQVEACSYESLKEECEDLARYLERLKIQIAAAQDSLREAKSASETLDKSRLQNAELKEMIATLTRSNDEMQQNVASLEHSDMLIFNRTDDFHKTPWLLLLSNEEMTLHGATGVSRTRETFTRGNFVSSWSGFQKWLDKRSPSTDYFLVLIKPSAASEHADITSKLTRGGFDFGIDVIAESATVEIGRTGEDAQ